MKNNKVTIYILLALVIGIWGYVLYTVFLKVNDDPVVSTVMNSKKNEHENLDYYRWKEDLVYDTIYRSPFLLAKSTIEGEPSTSIPPAPVSAYAAQPNYNALAYAPAMDIRYLGFIENEQQKQRIAILQINGKQYYMRTQQQHDGVKLLVIDTESIKIKTAYQTQTIQKTQQIQPVR